MKYTFKMLSDEYWWGGSVNDGVIMPFSADTEIEADFRKKCPNQGMPLFLSSRGRYIWSDEPFSVEIKNGVITAEGENITLTEAGDCLRDAYLDASRKHFPFGGKMPRREFFETAQYNTWMEFTYNQNQKGILEYAHAIIESGMKPGIFIIDEGWQKAYGDWQFDTAKFPDAKAMVEELHALGFKVMLWVVPYVMPCGVKWIREVKYYLNPEWEKHFLRNEDGEPAILDWWNGYSAVLDFENPDDCEFLDSMLRGLMEDYGIDGFKFDGGTLADFTGDDVINGRFRGSENNARFAMQKNIAWNEFGMRYPFHEYKDTFKGGGKPVIQRLRDRGHRWDEDGINTIIPNGLAQGLLGYPFICPDMIGGGEWSVNIRPDFRIDEELFVRMAQVSVFFPMMQFSWAPWRVLSKDNFEIVKKAAEMHAHLAPEIISEVEKAAKTGEPILRHLEYAYPHRGYQSITDEFLCGEDILVCPVVTKGTFEKDIVVPSGSWQSEDGIVYTEGVHRVKTPLDKIFYLRKIK